MAFRATAMVAVIIAMALTGGPAVASTWMPSWLDNLVNGGDRRAAASTELSSKDLHAASSASARRKSRRANREATARSTIAAADARTSRDQSARCLPSAAAVRKVQPTAWPKWTYGPQGERCWYAGAKPRFAKRPQQRTRVTRIAARPPSLPARQPASFVAPRPAPAAVPELDGRNTEPAPQPWALEYRWEGTNGLR
jgi:hypothetical protein